MKSTEKKKLEEVLKEYFLQEIKSEDLKGYKVIGMKENLEKVNSKVLFLETNIEAWIAKFKICLIPVAPKISTASEIILGNGNAGSYIVLVSQDCPEYYSYNSDEIMKITNEILETEDMEEKLGEYWWENWRSIDDANKTTLFEPTWTLTNPAYYTTSLNNTAGVLRNYSAITSTTC